MLEPAAARMVAKRRTSADLARLQEALDRHRASPADPAASFAADADFHRLIVELSGNETLQVLTGMIATSSARATGLMRQAMTGRMSRSSSRSRCARTPGSSSSSASATAKKPRNSGASTWPSRPRSSWATAARPRSSNCSPEPAAASQHPGAAARRPRARSLRHETRVSERPRVLKVQFHDFRRSPRSPALALPRRVRVCCRAPQRSIFGFRPRISPVGISVYYSYRYYLLCIEVLSGNPPRVTTALRGMR